MSDINKESKQQPVCDYFEYDARQTVFCTTCRRHIDLHLEREALPAKNETEEAATPNDPLAKWREVFPPLGTGRPSPFASSSSLNNPVKSEKRSSKTSVRNF